MSYLSMNSDSFEIFDLSFVFEIVCFDTPFEEHLGYSTNGIFLFPNILQKLNLLYCLVTLTTFVTVIWINLDILFASPVIVCSIDCRGWADLIHQANRKQSPRFCSCGKIDAIKIR